jgi:sulfate adenylyltransferase subunit 2
LTGAIESDADSLAAIIEELRSSRYSERQGRVIDRDGGSSMELKKQEGYF